MTLDAKFIDAARNAFATTAPSIVLGAPLMGQECLGESVVRMPLAMVNRHGLIAGATGTGKTRTLQLLAEQLSPRACRSSSPTSRGTSRDWGRRARRTIESTQRAGQTGFDWQPAAFPVEFLSLTGARGAQLRATVSSFGPLLLAKVLGLNETQTSVLALVFKYCDDREARRSSISPTCAPCSST